MTEQEYFYIIKQGLMGHGTIECGACEAVDACGGGTNCADALRRAHAKTQPPWVDLLVSTRHCPPWWKEHCGHSIQCDCELRGCWLSYLKTLGWEPVS